MRPTMDGMLLLVLIILFLLLFGFGFTIHVLWVAAVVALIVAAMSLILRQR